MGPRKWQTFLIHFLQNLVGVFVLIGVVDYFLMDGDWAKLRAGLGENFIVACLAAGCFALIDLYRTWKQGLD
jgi:hypothetical protein